MVVSLEGLRVAHDERKSREAEENTPESSTDLVTLTPGQHQQQEVSINATYALAGLEMDL
jgi:hypothetical protein